MKLFTANQKSTPTLQALMLFIVVVNTSAIATDSNNKASATISQQQREIEIAKLNQQLADLRYQRQKEIEAITNRLEGLENKATENSNITDNLPKNTVISISSKPVSTVRVSPLQVKKNTQTVNQAKDSVNTKAPNKIKVPKDIETPIKKPTNTASVSPVKKDVKKNDTKAKAKVEKKPKIDEMGELIWDKVIPTSFNSILVPISANKPTKKPVTKSILQPVSSALDLLPSTKINTKDVDTKSVDSEMENTKNVNKNPTNKQPKEIKIPDEPTLTIADKPAIVAPVGTIVKTTLWSPTEPNYKSPNNQTIKNPDPLASEVYLKALQAFSTNQTDIAISELQKYITKYPNEALIPKAHYWLGESYLQQKPANYSDAKNEFMEVINRYDNHPENDKQSKALYRLTQLSRVNNYTSELAKYAELLQQKYPDSEEAKLAKQLIQ